MIPQIKQFWPGAGTIHLDAWREVTLVDGYRISVVPKFEAMPETDQQLYFLNLGGYKAAEFDEFHYKLLVVAKDKNEAIRRARQTAFYKHTSIPGAPAHIDDKFGVDVDDLHEVKDILAPELKAAFRLLIKPGGTGESDALHLGYFPFSKL